jgi:hypothetical protein
MLGDSVDELIQTVMHVDVRRPAVGWFRQALQTQTEERVAANAARANEASILSK